MCCMAFQWPSLYGRDISCPYAACGVIIDKRYAVDHENHVILNEVKNLIAWKRDMQRGSAALLNRPALRPQNCASHLGNDAAIFGYF